jgi:hypothetical protein
VKVRLTAGAIVVLLGAARPASADPQVHAGLRGSVCHLTPESGARTRFCSGLVLDAHFGRERSSDFGVGPMLALSTAGFWDLRFGGGGSLLLPLHPDTPFVLAAGVFAHETRGVSVGGSLFWGFRGYNFHGNYNLGAGLFAEVLQDLDRERATVFSLGFELDAMLLAFPFLLLSG